MAGGAALAGIKRIEGIHVGVIGLAVNLVLTVGLSGWAGRAGGYEAERVGAGTPSASAK